jgi:hypothetical protein
VSTYGGSEDSKKVEIHYLTRIVGFKASAIRQAA